MRTLTLGLKQPENEDPSESWFPALADNIENLNDWTSVGQNLLAADWVDQGNGTYRQLVTIPVILTRAPGRFTFDTLSMQFRLSTGEIVHPTVEKVSDTTYYVYTNDNTLEYRALYSS